MHIRVRLHDVHKPFAEYGGKTIPKRMLYIDIAVELNRNLWEAALKGTAIVFFNNI